MSRPSSPILLTYEDDASHIEILDVPGLWILLYDGQSIGIRQIYFGSKGQLTKYPRTGFNNPAHAYRLAERLNRKFNTTLFTIVKIGE
jgi:hypothetical protein